MKRLKFILKVLGIAALVTGFFVSLGIILSNQYGVDNAPIIILSSLNVITLVCLAFFTYGYMKSTGLMAKEMQEQRIVASQPLVIQQPMYGEDVFESSASKHFSHFILWNAGNGPAIEPTYSILNKQKASALHVSHRRKTALRTGEEIIYNPEIFRLEAGNYYFVSQYINISRLTGKEAISQTWLPFELSKSDKDEKVYVVPGELSFKFDVPEEDLLDVFSRSSKPQ